MARKIELSEAGAQVLLSAVNTFNTLVELNAYGTPYARLADDAGLSTSCAETAIQELVELGLMTCEHKDDRIVEVRVTQEGVLQAELRAREKAYRARMPVTEPKCLSGCSAAKFRERRLGSSVLAA